MQSIASVREQFDRDLDSIFWQSLTEEARDAVTSVAAHHALFSGGKRFRPLLTLATGQALGLAPAVVTPFAVAVEFVHTYSLIHDDLPCLDNDDFRRNQPTLHKKFDEATALLAGDLLLTEASGVIARSYGDQPTIGLALVEKLVGRAGGSGMILGQILDLQFAGADSDQLKRVHRHKTGGLISLCVEGPAIIAEKAHHEQKALRDFGYKLGLSFQIKDDLLDADKNEAQNFVGLLGKVGTEELLGETVQQSMAILTQLSLQDSGLAELIQYNLARDH